MTAPLVMRTDVWDFVNRHDSGRIRRPTIDWLASVCSLDKLPGNVVLVVMKELDNIVAVSACEFKDKAVTQALVVVRGTHRNKGLGTRAIKITKWLLKRKGINYQAWVAGDNISSKRMLEKNGLIPIDHDFRQRGDNNAPYISLLMG